MSDDKHIRPSELRDHAHEASQYMGGLARVLDRAADTIDDLARGRVTSTHAERVTPEMLRAYLERSSEWRMRWQEDGVYKSAKALIYVPTNNGGQAAIVPDGEVLGWSARSTLKAIARAEQRGELAVYLDIVQGGDQ